MYFNLLASMLLWAYTLYVLKAGKLFVKKQVAPISKESEFLLNNILLVMMMAVVLLGTIYPGKLSVGAPYFNTALFPMLILLMLMMGIGILLKWQDKRRLKELSLYLLPLILGMVASAIVLYAIFRWTPKTRQFLPCL